VRALAVGANDNVGIETESKQKVTKEHRMVFTVTTALKSKKESQLAFKCTNYSVTYS